MKKLSVIVLLSIAGFFLPPILDIKKTDQPPTVEAVPETLKQEAVVNQETKNSNEVSEPKVTSDISSPQKQSVQTKGNYPEKFNSETTFIAKDKEYNLVKYKAFLTPNDPNYSQWWVSQTGLTSAWDRSSGVNTKVAIIDTGFALKHEEFNGRWLDNTLESGATILEDKDYSTCRELGVQLNKSCNGIDDDLNGFIDDFRGWDFSSDDHSPQAGESNPDGSSVWHGTAVAGIAAGTGNNGLGIAGVSWGAKILPLQSLDDGGGGDTLSITRAIRYAVDRDVDIINLSLGSDEEDPYLREAIHYALLNGVIVVAASGNDGCNCISYPANYPEVIAVGASNSSGSVTSFTSFGSNLDILAPGSNMRSTAWSKTNSVSSYINSISGTSFSSPYVSGLLANMRSVQPNASWGQLINSLLQSADRRNLTSSSPRSNSIGFGFVLADNTLIRASAPYELHHRYNFALDNRDTLSAKNANECENGQLPTAPFYEINEGAKTYYSISELTALLQRQTGATVTQKGYMCVGLPTDRIDRVRLIDPVKEFSNKSDK